MYKMIQHISLSLTVNKVLLTNTRMIFTLKTTQHVWAIRNAHVNSPYPPELMSQTECNKKNV